jgi:hypothetical protein
MKKVLVGALLFACALTTVAQESGDYVFTPVKELKVTPDQNLVYHADEHIYRLYLYTNGLQ